tara:strand:- start:48 stop:704 length:657 start_codon:yes stop_codon:yes gene_type:complete
MNICVSYPGRMFGDFIRYFIGLHTGQIKKENVKWEGWDSEYQWCFPLTGGPFLNHQPNRNIRIDLPVDAKGFLKLFEKRCPPPSTYVYKCNVRYLNTNHSIMDTPYYDVINSLGHKVIFVKLDVLSDAGDIYLQRCKMATGMVTADKKWHVDQARATNEREYPKNKLTHELQVDKLIDCDDNEYHNLIKFVDTKPLENWKKIVIEYRDWVKKPLDNSI